jgi:hypothetical protein
MIKYRIKSYHKSIAERRPVYYKSPDEWRYQEHNPTIFDTESEANNTIKTLKLVYSVTEAFEAKEPAQ